MMQNNWKPIGYCSLIHKFQFLGYDQLEFEDNELELQRRRSLEKISDEVEELKGEPSVAGSNPKQHHWVLLLHSKSNEVKLKLKHQAPTATEKMETASLAEELSGLRKKMERLRLDKEKTEKMLNGREGVLLLQMKEMEERGQIQRQLEIQVDRLFRLKELKSYCMRISPLKSLREKQQRGGWNINELHSLTRPFSSQDGIIFMKMAFLSLLLKSGISGSQLELVGAI
ncbi:hypothetical protein V6N13_099932 [Hibiscus sabdariffa]